MTLQKYKCLTNTIFSFSNRPSNLPIGKCDHDFSRLLSNLVVWDGVGPERMRGDHSHLMPEECRACLVRGWKEALGQSLKSAAMLWWYCIPDGGRGNYKLRVCDISRTNCRYVHSILGEIFLKKSLFALR